MNASVYKVPEWMGGGSYKDLERYDQLLLELMDNENLTKDQCIRILYLSNNDC